MVILKTYSIEILNNVRQDSIKQNRILIPTVKNHEINFINSQYNQH